MPEPLQEDWFVTKRLTDRMSDLPAVRKERPLHRFGAAENDTGGERIKKSEVRPEESKKRVVPSMRPALR